MTGEFYKDHPYITGYAISNQGNVRSPYGRILKPTVHKRTKNLYVCVLWNGKQLVRPVRQLVAETWMAYTRDTNVWIYQKNGDRMNCSVDNLTLRDRRA